MLLSGEMFCCEQLSAMNSFLGPFCDKKESQHWTHSGLLRSFMLVMEVKVVKLRRPMQNNKQ